MVRRWGPVNPVGVWPVKPGHELAVGGPCRVELVVAFCELPALLCGVLFQLGDAAVETVDVVGAAEAGLPPGLFAELLGQSLAELGVLAGQTGDAVMSVGEVRNEGCAGWRRVLRSLVGGGSAALASTAACRSRWR